MFEFRVLWVMLSSTLCGLYLVGFRRCRRKNRHERRRRVLELLQENVHGRKRDAFERRFASFNEEWI